MSAVSNPGDRRQQLRERDGDNCWICGEPMDFTAPPHYKLAVTIDHVIPRAAGGRSLLKNLRLAHSKCNNRKGAVHNGVDYARIRDREAARRIARPLEPPPLPPKRRRQGLQQSVGEAFWAAYLRAAEKEAKGVLGSDERYARWVEEGRRLLAQGYGEMTG